MGGAGIQDWAFWITGAVLALGGGGLAVWALFGDRSRGRSRCPGCWYDMSGVPAVTRDGREKWVCPECGRHTAGPRGLLRVRRRWRVAGLSLVALLTGGIGIVAPLVYRPDRAKLLPSWALVFIADPDAYPARLPNEWDRELELRLKGRRLAPWQMQVAMDRHFAAQPLDLSGAVRTRSRWPAGISLKSSLDAPPVLWDRNYSWTRARARLVRPADSSESGWVERQPGDGLLVDLGLPPKGAASVLIEVEFLEQDHRLWRGRFVAPTLIGGSPEELLKPVASEMTDSAVARWMHARLVLRDGAEPDLLIEDRGRERVLGEYLALGVHFEVARQGRIVAHGAYIGHAELDGLRCGNEPTWEAVQLEWSDTPPAQVPDGESWEIRARGDRELALADIDLFCLGGKPKPDPTKYWAGSFTVPVNKFRRYEAPSLVD